MKSYTLFGNCQAAAMRWVLQGCQPFTETYELVDVPASYQMDEEAVKAFCQDTLPSLDLLFMQPHSAKRSHWHNHETISSHAQTAGVNVVKFPQIYWNAYNPFETQLPIVNADVSDELTYVDTLVMQAVLDGKSFEAFQDGLRADHDRLALASVQALKRANDSMIEVEIGRKCDFPVTDFLAAHFTGTRLMHNNNHPTGPTMNLLCNRLLAVLDPSWKSEAAPDLFPNHDSIVYAFTTSGLNLSFTTSDEDIHRRFASYTSYAGGLTDGERAEVLKEVSDYARHVGL